MNIETIYRRQNMDSEFNQLILLAEKKGKKGDGLNAVLVLMQDMRDFQDKLENAIEAQAIRENKQKLEAFNSQIESFWSDLVEIVSGGIRDVRTQSENQGITEGPKPILSNPQIPRLGIA